MKKENPIRDAIDESLCGVRFNQQDMRRVLRAVRRQEEPSPSQHRRRRFRLDYVFACALVLLIVVPMAALTLSTCGTRVSTISAAPGVQTVSPASQSGQSADGLSLTPSSLSPAPVSIHAEEAVRIARACYEAQCDTSIFTFDEFTVDTVYVHGEGSSSDGAYTVTLKSIYGNGCTFTVVVDATDGTVLHFSDPRLATTPLSLDGDSDEISAWYEKNGPYLFTWPQEDQAEFSRRYEGAMLRTAREGELSEEEAKALAAQAASDALQSLGISGEPACYAMLYDGRCSADGRPRYVVYCFASPVTDPSGEPFVLVTLRAEDGAVESVREGDSLSEEIAPLAPNASPLSSPLPTD